MCHDEPRESPKKGSSNREHTAEEEVEEKPTQTNGMFDEQVDVTNNGHYGPLVSSAAGAPIVQPVPVSASQIQALDAGHHGCEFSGIFSFLG
jgi:hypothetical protein